MVYKSGQIFLPFCHNPRRLCDGRTDGQTDRQTDRILIAIPRLHYVQRGKNNLDPKINNNAHIHVNMARMKAYNKTTTIARE